MPNQCKRRLYKTRETRITHISSEAVSALRDYLSRKKIEIKNERYLFLFQHGDGLEILKKKTSQKCSSTCHNLEKQLSTVLKNIPEISEKNENGRNSIYFHALRAWFKTQVTDAHQSDFAEALMDHKSLKLVYYCQNDKDRAQTYLDVEYALTIAETEKIDNNY
ncbi:tyrosine-type recombinase/integrase [Nitrosopumilus ureiphilus]|uniref:tyrosine-type recombinase/integrase n=1 Tax=Nitrosopumilus ureiphilus TaxID=1470067 RepID=UPI002475721B|nr:tyrosine-type recombinase/integrase [Nitrosopumilus ureiphilus]